MELKEYTKKINVRKISRALYALIPHEVAEELRIEEGETAKIMVDRDKRIIAFKFEREQ